jgi:hypothetical protein
MFFTNYRNEESKLKEIAEYVTNFAIHLGYLSCTASAERLRRIRAAGEEIPDELLPGRALLRAMQNFPEELQKLVSKLKGRHFDHQRIIDFGIEVWEESHNSIEYLKSLKDRNK